jgi:Acetyltransferase (GNAT) family
MTIIRSAREADLRPAYEVYYQTEMLGDPQPPPAGETPPALRHILHTGRLSVAEQDGEVIAFAGAITRGSITFLTDLFVRPNQQSSRLGKTLLHSVLPQDELIHCTSSSSDPRALALYIRAGMRPRWPHFALQLERPVRAWSSTTLIEVVEANPADQELLSWDARISGRTRPLDHEFWVREERGVPLWLRRQGRKVGYAYVRLGRGTLGHRQDCKLGPIGVDSPADAADCVLATVDWAIQRAQVLRIEVPGPHPCLAPLLEGGFRLSSCDTFVSTSDAPFFDACCYITSGGDLF